MKHFRNVVPGALLFLTLVRPAVHAQAAWPVAVSNAGMAWDASTGAVLLYGGMRDQGAHADSALWAWNGTTWSALGNGAPGPRSGLILAFDPQRNRVLLHGGQNRAAQFDDTWEWRAGQWTQVSTTGPGARHMTAGTFDPVRKQLVLFGGYDVGQQAMRGDTWLWNGESWRQSTAEGPPPRAGHVLGFDASAGEVILMGGSDGQGRPFTDSWSWDGAQWTRIGDGPPITPNTQLVPVPGGGVATFGGWDGSKPTRSLYHRNGGHWEAREDPSGPSPRLETALAFDDRRSRLVLFGGSAANGSKLNDLWEYDGRQWRVMKPSPGPAFTTTGAFFALSVPDLDASVRWYSEKLGLEVSMRPQAHAGIEVAVLEGGGLIVELIQRNDAQPLGRIAPQLGSNDLVHGFFKAGLVVEDFESTVATLRTRGVEIAFGPFPARPGQRANVLVRDNAGNLIQFFGR